IATVSLFGAMYILPLISCGLVCMGNAIGSGSRSGGGGEIFALAGQCINLIGVVCQIGWFFVFMFFLRCIATSMGNHGLGRAIVAHMIAWPVFLTVAILGWIVLICVGGMAAVG